MLTNNTVSNSEYGILLEDSSNNILTGNSASNNENAGLFLAGSSNNKLTNNTASNNAACGIFLEYSSNNILTNNTASNNDCGIFLDYSSNNILTGNNASNNGWGIYLEYSNNNILTDNTAYNNVECGIVLQDSSNDILANNTILNNDVGIYLNQSSDNTFINNIASDNTNYDFYSDEFSRSNAVNDLAIASYPTTISFIYDNGIGIKSVTTPEPDPAGKVNISKYVHADSVTDDSWIFLNVSYDNADVTNVVEDSLRLYHWTGTWEEIPGSNVNTAENYVYANVTSFSQIAPFGNPKSEHLG